MDDAVTHVTLPGHFPRPGPDLGGARGIATGVAGGVFRKRLRAG